MDNIREFSYKINGLALVADDVIKSFESDFSGVKGVIGLNLDKENETVKYALDQWLSDYDVFCKLNEICEKFGLELDYGDTVEEIKIEEKPEEIETQDGLDEQTDDDNEKEEEVKKGKLTKSDIIEKFIVFGLAIVVTVVGLFLKKSPNAQAWVLMVGFTLASYETLYSLIVKIAEKSYVFEELITFCGALILMYLGYTTSAFAVMLIYGIIGFIESYLIHRTVVFEEKLEKELTASENEEEKAVINEKLEFLRKNKGVCDAKTAKFSSNRLKYNIAFIILALLLTFIPPFFNIKTYGAQLTGKWLYVGASTLVLGCFGSVLFSLLLTAKITLIKCIKEGVKVNDYDSYLKLAGVSGVCLDDSVITSNDAHGAVMEIKEDIELAVNIVSGKSGEEVTEIKKDLNANGGLAGANANSKVKYAEKCNAVLVSKENMSKNINGSEINSIIYGENGDICVNGNELKKVPFIIKMARRTAKVLKMNNALPLLVKILLVVLLVVTKVVLSMNSIWWIVILDLILNVGLYLNAIRNVTDPV